jgi:hypothetical protein
VAVVFTPVQTKQIRINRHKRNNTKHSTNNTKHSTNNTKHSTCNTKQICFKLYIFRQFNRLISSCFTPTKHTQSVIYIYLPQPNTHNQLYTYIYPNQTHTISYIHIFTPTKQTKISYIHICTPTKHTQSVIYIYLTQPNTQSVIYIYLSPFTSCMCRCFLHDLQADHCVICSKTICFLQCCYIVCAAHYKA